MATAQSSRRFPAGGLVLAAGIAILTAPALLGQQDSKFRFKTGVDLVNVSATVTDADGRFVRNLAPDDFAVYEDGVRQTVSYFSNERVPVSLGIALDTSGSMAGEKIGAAQEALSRFLEDLLGPDDEVFVYRFSTEAVLVQGWTTDRGRFRSLLGRIQPSGGTMLYDTVAESIPLAQAGHHRKKALVIISDGNDTGSGTSVNDVRQLILQSEVLVYAVGIDGRATPSVMPGRSKRPPFRLPIPWPGGGRVPGAPVPRLPIPQPPGPSFPPVGGGTSFSTDERVNESALRSMTDDSGGRTEIIRTARDLDPATAGIADELSRQYYLAYQSPAPKDGKWHDIRVEVRNRTYLVRARKGFVAS